MSLPFSSLVLRMRHLRLQRGQTGLFDLALCNSRYWQCFLAGSLLLAANDCFLVVNDVPLHKQVALLVHLHHQLYLLLHFLHFCR